MRTDIGTRSRTAVFLVALVALLAGPAAGSARADPIGTQAAPSVVRSAVEPAALKAYPKHGQRSAAVRALQEQLIEADLMRAQHRTGYFGNTTKAAVRTLQRRYKLAPTGRVDAGTTAALTRAVRAMTGPATWYQRQSIGTSAEGRPIVAYRAGQAGRPVVVVLSTMHGEEDFGQYVARGLLEGRKIRGVDLWVVPVVNPDGFVRDRRWVSSRVDLNRNFPHRFIVRANSGPRASSAKETRVMMAFLNRTKPRYLVSWHQPLIGVDSYTVKDRALMNRLSKGLRIPVRRLDCHGSCHGTMTGWFNARHRGAAITVEYGAKARSTKTMKVRDANAVLKAVGGRRA